MKPDDSQFALPPQQVSIDVLQEKYAKGGEQTADVLSRACGHWGTGAEYLMHTVAHLEDLGIHDRYLWRLQELVAERIKAAAKGRELPIAAS